MIDWIKISDKLPKKSMEVLVYLIVYKNVCDFVNTKNNSEIEKANFWNFDTKYFFLKEEKFEENNLFGKDINHSFFDKEKDLFKIITHWAYLNEPVNNEKD